MIYVKNFMVKQPEKEEKEPEKPVNTQNCENHNSRVVKTTIQECPKSQFKNDENHNSGMMKTTIQECAESQFKNDENHNSGIVKITTLECPKSQSNNTDINNTDFSENEYNDTESSETDFNETDNILSNPSHLSVRKTAGMIDMVEEMEAYRKIIRENISYECFEDSSRIEGGQTAMSIEIFRKLAVILKTDAGTLLGECKEEENHRLYDLICRAKKLKRKEQKILEKTMEVLIEGFGTEL